MEGDLSLTQTLGGLRIANNPDNSPPDTPKHNTANTLNPAVDSDSEGEREFQRRNEPRNELPPPLNQGVVAPLHNAYFANAELNPSTSLPNHHLQPQHHIPPQQLPQPPQQQAFNPQQQQQDIPARYHHTHHLQAPSGSRPNSSFIPSGTQFLPSQPLPEHPNLTTNSQNAVVYTGDYVSRSNRDYARASVAGYSNIKSHERQPSDRSYRQSAIPPSLVPPRSNSARHHGGRGMMEQGAPYGVEGGPAPSSQEWIERGAAVAVRRETDSNGVQQSRIIKKGVKDFQFGRVLGEGSYSTVMSATDRQTLTEYAVKVLDKRHIIKEKKVKYVNIEKNTLNRLGDHPGIVRLYYTFQDERSLYFVLDLATGGELLGFIKRMGTFDEECTRYYGAQILDAVEYMHAKGVIHRDLKPENVLLDDQMHVKITDFGTAKLLDPPAPAPAPNGGGNSYGPDIGSNLDKVDDSRANSFVGTAEYVSPELLTDKAACKSSDLWAFGCIVFQLLSGRPPFKAGNEYQTFQKIVNLEYTFPPGFPPIGRDLVERLLVLDPTKRLTIEHIKNHPFFDGITWGRRLWKQKAPRLKPYVPPPQEPNVIKLDSVPPNVPRNPPGQLGHSGSTAARPHPPTVITELPPPTQLDLEWSPVLTKTNERILKVGNMTVISAPAPHPQSVGEGGAHGAASTDTPPKKLARFFQSSQTKKRQRLVMITSCARILIAAVGAGGGDASKIKAEIDLLGLGVLVRNVSGASGGLGAFAIDTKDKCYTFEDGKVPAIEWLEAVDRARDLAAANYMLDEGTGGLNRDDSDLSSPSSTLGGGKSLDKMSASAGLRLNEGGDANKGRHSKRFSRRHSKNGLAAVF